MGQEQRIHQLHILDPSRCKSFRTDALLMTLLSEQGVRTNLENIRIPTELGTGLHATEIAMIRKLGIHHQPGSRKDTSLRRSLTVNDEQIPAVPDLFYPAETVEEKAFNTLACLEANSQRIAAIKAMLFDETQSRETVNPFGCLDIERAHDVITAIGNGKEKEPQFKPAPGTSKEEIVNQLRETLDRFSTQTESGEVVLLTWEATDALYERNNEIGVGVKGTATYWIEKPSDAFLYCMYFGTERILQTDPEEVPKEYRKMARAFTAIAKQGTPYCPAGTEAHAERLRGWTQENGVISHCDINGGFQGDSLFIEELLGLQINGVDKQDPQFHKQMQQAVDMVMGKAVYFDQAFRALTETIRTVRSRVVLEQTEEEREFQKAMETVQEFLHNLGRTVSLPQHAVWKFYNADAVPLDSHRYKEYVHWLLATAMACGTIRH